MIAPPILVADTEGWLSIFSSVAECEAEIESPDVEAGEYVAFDSEGRVLRLVVVVDPAPRRWWRALSGQAPVRLEVSSDSELRPELLAALLSEALGQKVEGEVLGVLLHEAVGRKSPRAPHAIGVVRAAVAAVQAQG
jgi:hypothetical protein